MSQNIYGLQVHAFLIINLTEMIILIQNAKYNFIT